MDTLNLPAKYAGLKTELDLTVYYFGMYTACENIFLAILAKTGFQAGFRQNHRVEVEIAINA
jgi:hypothetical protein